MKVIITDYEYENVNIEKEIITKAGFDFASFQCKEEQELTKICRDADIVIVQYGQITRHVINSMKNCKAIIRYGIGVDNIDTQAATERGIFVCNIPDYGVDEVSNHAITLLMALTKKIQIITTAMKNGDRSYSSIIPIYRMNGKTLGLVGLGRIPSLVAKKMQDFGLKILAYDPYLSPEEGRKRGAEIVNFDTLLSASDYVSIHCPLTKDTYHLFDHTAFSKMKPTAILINTARGSIIKEKDLIYALQNHKIAAAGLDVYEKEPLIEDSPLLKMDNVICTPHCAWYSVDAIKALHQKAAEEAIHILNGNIAINAVNLQVLENK